MLLLLFSLYSAQAQNTFPASGYAGVNAVPPLSNFHVNGILRWGGYNDNFALSGEDALGLFIEQLGTTRAKSGIRIQSSSSSDTHNYTRLNIDPYYGFSFMQLYGGNGNVGIGTDRPASILDVRAEASNASKFNFQVTGSWGGAINQDHGMLISGARFATNTNTSLLHITNNDSTSLFRVTDWGNVGIGTSNPSEKLAVDGNIKANGTVFAKKLKIEANNWPDYVFAEGYELRSLSSLEAFIMQNKHLPEVLTSKEVEEEGISVGDNQALLLKKIEELTLYLIQQDKKINNVIAENKKLKQVIKNRK